MSPNTFILAPQVGWKSTVPTSCIVKRLRSVFSRIEDRGHSVCMLASVTSSPPLGRSTEVARLLESETPGSVRWVNNETASDAYFVLWPKDGFCDWGAFIAVADAPGLRAFVLTLGKPVRSDSTLCEGGMFIRAKDWTLMSSALPDRVDLHPGPRRVRLPHPYCSDKYRRHQPEHQPLTHLDLDLAIVPWRDSGMLLVSERYQSAYQEAVAQAAEHFQLEVFQVPQEEVNRRGLNLVVLSEQAVLLPSGCPRLRDLLTDRLGTGSVMEILIDDVFNYNGGRGGLGCMSNVVCEGKH